MEKLVEIAKVQSTESSNRIEGIVTTSTRVREIVEDKTIPRNRDEYEIAGYSDVLNTIHENYEYIPIESRYILQLHRDLTKYTGTSVGGVYKSTQNYIRETRPDGTTFVRFFPAAPYETGPYMDAACDSYRKAFGRQDIDPLLIIPVFLTDFLCIHLFL